MKNMKGASKLVFLSLGMVFLAAACGNASQPQTNPDSQNRQQQNSQTPAPPAEPQTGKLTVTQTVEASNFNQPGPYEVEEGSTALDLLKSTHQVETKSYSGVGQFVTAIDGVEPKNNEFWALYVNGAQATVGAGSYELKNNNQISWKLEKMESYK